MFSPSRTSRRSERAIHALLSESTITDAAETARISVACLQRLLSKPSFQSRLRKARVEALSRVSRPALGEVFGHYRILERLSDTAEGPVFRAEDLDHRRVVALKLACRGQISDETVRQNLKAEALAAAGLNHPNICPIYEVGEVAGDIFVAMACAPGGSLSEMLKDGPLPFDSALDIASQVACALNDAHAHGVIHRNIKPANIFVTRREGIGLHVAVMDFRLERIVRPLCPTQEGDKTAPDYLSPEQTAGVESDERTDVWALGAVLYEMIAGRRPFRGAFSESVSYSILYDEPEPLLSLRRGTPIALEWIVRRALAKSPKARYETVMEMRSDMQDLLAAFRRKPETASRGKSLVIGLAAAAASFAGHVSQKLPFALPPLAKHKATR